MPRSITTSPSHCSNSGPSPSRSAVRTRSRRPSGTSGVRDRQPPEIRTIRGLEAQVAALKSQLRVEQRKYAQAESELCWAEQSLETYQATHGAIRSRRLGRGAAVSRGYATAVLCCND